jgi:GH24 family phage-related lysozyme (muramidase)
MTVTRALLKAIGATVTAAIGLTLAAPVAGATAVGGGAGAGQSALSGAGTSIGNAARLTGAASGSLTSSLSDDWWVVYPAVRDGQVTIRVDDTVASTTQPCADLDATFADTNGYAVTSFGLIPNTFYATPFSSSHNSDRYFVELTTGGCNPLPGQPLTYTLDLQAGGGGTPPSPASGSATPGTTIGGAQTPLQGATSYTGTILIGVSQGWYVLDKHPDTNSATIRVENTTVKGSTPCPLLDVTLTDTDGMAISSVGLTANTATTFIVSSSQSANGRFFLRLTDGGCTSGGTTYRIEPEPGGEWDNPGPAPRQVMPTGPIISQAGGPLTGGVVYETELPAGQPQVWTVYDPTGQVPVTASVQNETSNQSNCTIVGVTQYGPNGSPISSMGLSDNSGHEFTTATTGPFYLEISNDGCTPGPTSPPQKVDVELTPAQGVTGPNPVTLAVPVVENFEGFRPYPYNDAAGHCTIGYGTKLSDGRCTAAIKQKYAAGISRATAAQLLQQALQQADQAVGTSVKVPLLPNERAALDSFVYNVGSGAFKGSTLLKNLNQGNKAAAAQQLLRWVHAGGKVLKGLQNRRQAELNLFIDGSTTGCGAVCAAATTSPPATTSPAASAASSVGATSAAPTASASGPQLTASPTTATAGQAVTVTGSGWGTAGGCGPVQLQAVVTDISPYDSVPLSASVTSGTLSATWQTSSSIIDTLPWQLSAAQTCGTSLARAAATVTVSAA